ncbi:hypothetical protein E3A20_26680, partial [Planctomyces bekefii]
TGRVIRPVTPGEMMFAEARGARQPQLGFNSMISTVIRINLSYGYP